ncbi:AAA family ATPase/60S ribosome export protein Rix7 [Perkinsela sp. CCAP 1560/4]|nr:AAA family ATPase/60S ribosome export protein Rix7 [Perkinsela sp. CCAP 1560/4]|eukprot:KNH04655.1 AAA family ATPase/60S ribosome export protein Rix7 [Perkinsela sp. CCAP 1560/4]
MPNSIDDARLCDYIRRLLAKLSARFKISKMMCNTTCVYEIPVNSPSRSYSIRSETSKDSHFDRSGINQDHIIPTRIVVLTGKVFHKKTLLDDIILRVFAESNCTINQRVLTTRLFPADEFADQPIPLQLNTPSSQDCVFYLSSFSNFLADGVDSTSEKIVRSLSTDLKSLRASSRLAVLVVDNLEELSFICEEDSRALLKEIDAIEDRLRYSIGRRHMLPPFVCFMASELPTQSAFLSFDAIPVFDLSRETTPQKRFGMSSIAEEILLEKGIIRQLHPSACVPPGALLTKEYEEAKSYCTFRIRKMLSIFSRSRSGESLTSLDKLCDIQTGVLLHGPPGCGKTMLIHELIRTFKSECSFFAIFSPLLLSAFLGESESLVRSVFAFLRSKKPCVYIFEGLHCIAQTRENSVSRILYALLCELDGIGSTNAHILGIATTHQPLEQLDQAIVRPGRFGAVFNLAS